MRPWVVRRRGSWDDLKAAAVVVMDAPTAAHARVKACEAAGDDAFGSDSTSVCRELGAGETVVISNIKSD